MTWVHMLATIDKIYYSIGTNCCNEDRLALNCFMTNTFPNTEFIREEEVSQLPLKSFIKIQWLQCAKTNPNARETTLPIAYNIY